MSFIGDLFGGGSSQPAAQPSSVNPTPTISGAASQSAGMEEAARLKNRTGTDQSILTSGLGDTSAGATNINRTSALGGNSSLTQ
jgi:hypothetical protein